MNAREELNRIKNLYKESNRYMLTLSYEDIGILISIIDALNKRAKMDKERNFHFEKSNEMFVDSYSKMAKAFNIKSYAINENIIINHINENFISKDKIKEKLELLKDILKAKEKDGNIYKQIPIEYLKGAIEQLEELMKGE